ncbi:MAG: hypothetical protein ACJASV_003187 [Pseudorhodobacter sp.]|jgi:hypothetical protein
MGAFHRKEAQFGGRAAWLLGTSLVTLRLSMNRDGRLDLARRDGRDLAKKE